MMPKTEAEKINDAARAAASESELYDGHVAYDYAIAAYEKGAEWYGNQSRANALREILAMIKEQPTSFAAINLQLKVEERLTALNA